MAAIPRGIESWRKPVVFEKTRTANLGCVPSASAAPLKGATRTLKTISSNATLAFIEPVGHEGLWCPGLLAATTSCVGDHRSRHLQQTCSEISASG
jgi:hypothetical protein